MERPVRKPNRLREYDYSQPGCYFVTICTKERLPLLRRGAQCAPASDLPPLTEAGRAAEQAIKVLCSDMLQMKQKNICLFL